MCYTDLNVKAKKNGDTNMQKNKKYRFYGWESADVKDEYGMTPRDCYDLLCEVWCEYTCAPRMRDKWSVDDKTLGQCSITAFLMQDIYGGVVRGVPLGDGNYHCFNDVDGCVFDLTSEQFGDEKLNYSGCPEQKREVHFSKKEKEERYIFLKSRFNALREKAFTGYISRKTEVKK